MRFHDMHQPGETSGKAPVHIILSRGGRASCFTVRPLIAAAAVGGCALLVAGYLGAAGYLMLYDGETGGPGIEEIRQARVYEDRIADLRARIDHITSRSLVAQHNYERQIDLLTRRQGEIDQRHTRVADVLARAAESGLTIAGSEPLPVAKPRAQMAQRAALPESAETGGDAVIPVEVSAGGLGLRGSVGAPARKADRKARTAPAPQVTPMPVSVPADIRADTLVMGRIGSALEVMDRQSAAALDLIAVAAERRIARIEHVTRSLGLVIDGADDAVGGPFEPIVSPSFDNRLKRAEHAITRLSSLRSGARSLPFGTPLDGTLSVSSTFGPRLDPFLRSPAMHTGLDVRAPNGTPIHATAGGTVVSAGRNGGYGLMVEIDHGNGILTRYGHMSRVLVSAGDTVDGGETIGLVGSSGRSTGAHLHYETRLSSGPVDPQIFLTAGKKLTDIL